MATFLTGCLRLIAKKSKERYKVGAIYRQGWRVSWGYNISATYGHHAEDMALRRFESWYGKKPSKGTMYCTFSPCNVCSRTLGQAGITSVYINKYTGKL